MLKGWTDDWSTLPLGDLKELKSNNADDVEAELNHAREYSFQLEKQLFPHLQGREKFTDV